AGLVERALRFAPLGDVAGDLRETDQRTVVVVDGVDDDAGPESPAVLANPPAFGLEHAVAFGNFQRPGRQAGGAVLLGIEPGEMLSDDLVGRVALESLCAGIPARDDPVGIEQ